MPTERTPLAHRGLLHGSTHAPDHEDLTDLLESMHTTQAVTALFAVTALAVAVAALLLAVFK